METPGKRLDFGRTADILELGPDRVVKLFHSWVPESDIDLELEIVKMAHSLGAPTPAAFGKLHFDGRTGIVFERLEGESMLARIGRDPAQAPMLAHRLAQLQWELHALKPPAELRTQRDFLAAQIDHAPGLPPELREAALQRLAGLPEGDRLCHGDFHPANVMLVGEEIYVIDWTAASRGNPAGDMARASLLLLGFIENFISGQQEQSLARRFHQAFLDAYFDRAPHLREESELWMPVVAAARLSERIPEEEAWLLQQARLRLEGL